MVFQLTKLRNFRCQKQNHKIDYIIHSFKLFMDIIIIHHQLRLIKKFHLLMQ